MQAFKNGYLIYTVILSSALFSSEDYFLNTNLEWTVSILATLTIAGLFYAVFLNLTKPKKKFVYLGFIFSSAVSVFEFGTMFSLKGWNILNIILLAVLFLSFFSSIYFYIKNEEKREVRTKSTEQVKSKN